LTGRFVRYAGQSSMAESHLFSFFSIIINRFTLGQTKIFFSSIYLIYVRTYVDLS